MPFKKNIIKAMRNVVLLVGLSSVILMSTKLISASAWVSVSELISASRFITASDFTDLDQNEIVEEMGAGWNLGNQLEASIAGVPYETAWGNPIITETIIKAVKEAGFSTIRVPVSYLNHIGNAPEYKIDSSWLDRVQEVVDLCIENGLYVVINMHGDGYHTVDGGWLFCDDADQTTIRAKYKACWKQIATRFASYDEHLIFESMNEEFDGTYGTPDKLYYSNINELNQIFVDTVRKTGGNNDKRWLLIPGWNTNIEYTVGDYGFSLPSDNYLSDAVPSQEKRIMISVHYYDPWEFCGEESGVITQWGDSAKDASKVTENGDESFLSSQFKNLYSEFINKGYPVVIGEYGAIDKSSHDLVNAAGRVEFARKVSTFAKMYRCVPVWWDNGYNGEYGFALFDRSTGEITQQDIIDAITAVYKTGLFEPDNSKPDVSVPDASIKDEVEAKVIFGNGIENETYATIDASWLTKASDDAVIMLKYTCTEPAYASAPVLEWGASVNGTWVNGSTYNASSSAKTVTVTLTAGELKESLGIMGSTSVDYLELRTYNNGVIISVSVLD